MSLTKSLLLGVHWSLKTLLKPFITLALSHKYSDFDLDNKKWQRKINISEIIEIPHYLQCFKRKPWILGRSGVLF